MGVVDHLGHGGGGFKKPGKMLIYFMDSFEPCDKKYPLLVGIGLSRKISPDHAIPCEFFSCLLKALIRVMTHIV